MCSYSGNVIPVAGEIFTEIEYEGHNLNVKFVIVKGSKVALLGRDLLWKIRLNWQEIFKINASEDQEFQEKIAQIKRKHGKVFGHGKKDTVKKKSEKVNVKLKKGIKPRFKKARSVPFASREPVECELERQVVSGVLKPVKSSAWATPIMGVPKANGDIRICGDYKVTVNPCLEEEYYPPHNILIVTDTQEEHLDILDLVLTRLEEHGLQDREVKCVFGFQNVTYIGHYLDADGIHCTKDKLEAIMNMRAPENVTELQSFLGLITYYQKFIPNLSSMFQPLHQLLQKDVTWEWTAGCEQAMQQAKDVLMKEPVLIPFDPKRQLVLACDASPYGLGAVLPHVMDDGSERPIANASCTLTKLERNYSQIEKEALGIIFGVQKFHKYLYGQTFVLYTDHKPLVAIFAPDKEVLFMSYQYEIKYKRSSDNVNADALSRVPDASAEPLATEHAVNYISHVDDLPITSTDVAEETRRDLVLSRVWQYTMNGWPDSCDDEALQPYFRRRHELSNDQGMLLWGLRVVILPKSREQLIQELHDDHTGIGLMKSTAPSYIWYSGIDQDIESVAADCERCAAFRKNPPAEPFVPWPVAHTPWQRIHVDFGEIENKNLLIITDSYSKWPEVEIMSSTTAEATIRVLRHVFAHFGLPHHLVSDNEPQFMSSEFQTFIQCNGVDHILTPPYHPNSNEEECWNSEVLHCKGIAKHY